MPKVLPADTSMFARKSTKRSIKAGTKTIEKAYVKFNHTSYGIQTASVTSQGNFSGHLRIDVQRNVLKPTDTIRDFVSLQEVLESDGLGCMGAFYGARLNMEDVDLGQVSGLSALASVLSKVILEAQTKLESDVNGSCRDWDSYVEVDALSAIVIALRDHNVEVSF